MDPVSGGISAIAGLGSMIANAVSAHKAAKRQRANEAAGKKRAAAAFSNIQGRKVLNLDEVYKKLQFGKGADDLRKYQIGEALKQKKLDPTAYEQLAKNKLINRNTRANLKGYRQLADTGFRDIDRAELRKSLKTQRNENKSIQDTLTRRAVERGANKGRASLTQRLLAAQGAANRGESTALNVAAQGAQRRIQGLAASEGAVAREYQRRQGLAAARDRIAGANTGIANQARRTNWQRKTGIGDKNTGLQNTLVERNEQGRTAGNVAVNTSHNTQQELLANQNNQQADRLFGQADKSGQAASHAAAAASQSAGNFAGGVGQLFNHGAKAGWFKPKSKKSQ